MVLTTEPVCRRLHLCARVSACTPAQESATASLCPCICLYADPRVGDCISVPVYLPVRRPSCLSLIQTVYHWLELRMQLGLE